MKKLILIPAAAGILAFGGIVLANTDSVAGPNTANGNSEDTNNTSTGEMIGFEKASSIALAISEGQVTDIELSDDDGRQQYEVDIRDKDYEYDYEIDAFTGDVLEQDRDHLDDDDDREMNQSVDETQAAPEDLIAAEEASEIALQQSNGGTIVELDLDDDDGVKHYDVEVVNGDKEFELEINAADGKVLKFEQDENDDDDDWEDNDDNDRDDD